MAEAKRHAGPEYLLAPIIEGFMQHMHGTGLSRPQIHALLYIYHAGECRVSEIGALTHSSPAAASQLVERLVRQGLVERTEDPENRRVKKLRLTGKSLELIHQGAASNRALMELMTVLTPQQRKTVHAALDYLAEAGRKIHSSHKRKDKQHAAHS